MPHWTGFEPRFMYSIYSMLSSTSTPTCTGAKYRTQYYINHRDFMYLYNMTTTSIQPLPRRECLGPGQSSYQLDSATMTGTASYWSTREGSNCWFCMSTDSTIHLLPSIVLVRRSTHSVTLCFVWNANFLTHLTVQASSNQWSLHTIQNIPQMYRYHGLV